MKDDFQKSLVEEILRARERIYRVNGPTPIEKYDIGGIEANVFLKREDLSAIKAYKWRGAYNCIAALPEEKKQKPLVAASAGNHAQGVALACRLMGLKGRIYMPLAVPQMKKDSVKKHGGDAVEIVLTGDNFNEAAAEAMKYVEAHDTTYIHPYDDLYTIAGQGTIADEVVLSGKGPFDYAFVQIGGGGMASGVATWLKIHYPNIKVIGVEGVDQASMKASVDAGELVTLESVDTFCDGTAVTRPGDICFKICQSLLDDIVTVTNEEVSSAIETTWEIGRFIPEPSGALGLAGLIKYAAQNKDAIRGKNLLSVICGANMDFSKLRLISANYAVGSHRVKVLRFHIHEKSGSLLNLLTTYYDGVSVKGFQYGKISDVEAYPVISLEAEPEDLDSLTKRLLEDGVLFEDVTGHSDIRYKIINYNPAIMHEPIFLHIHFPERIGALRELLSAISGKANICYFNYEHTGEAIGRALMGFELYDVRKEEFEKTLKETKISYRPVEEEVIQRILSV